MNSYPTTRLGKIHIRRRGKALTGDTFCGRLASSGQSVSMKTYQVGTCQNCHKAMRRIEDARLVKLAAQETATEEAHQIALDEQVRKGGT